MAKYLFLNLLVIILFLFVPASADVLDDSGDVSDPGIDLVKVELIGNDIVLTLVETPTLSAGSAFMVLISSDYDHNTWEAGIVVIGSTSPTVYWNIGDLCNNQWNLDTSKLRQSGSQLILNFIEFQELIVSEVAVLSISGNLFDWAPNMASTYADFSVFYSVSSGIIMPPGAGYLCNHGGNQLPSTILSTPPSVSSPSISSTPTSTGTPTSDSRSENGNSLPIPLEITPILIALLISYKFKISKSN